MIRALYRVEYRRHTGKTVKLTDLSEEQINEIVAASEPDGFRWSPSKEDAESGYFIRDMKKIIKDERFVASTQLVEVDQETYDDVMFPWKKYAKHNKEIEQQIYSIRHDAEAKIEELQKQAHHMCGYCANTGHSYCDDCVNNAYNLFDPENEE